MAAQRAQAGAGQGLPAESAKGRAMPDFLEVVVLQVAHHQVAVSAGQNRAVHLEVGMQPADIAGQFFPNRFPDPKTPEDLVDPGVYKQSFKLLFHLLQGKANGAFFGWGKDSGGKLATPRFKGRKG